MLFYITGGAPQAVPGTACVEANQTACTEVCYSSGSRTPLFLGALKLLPWHPSLLPFFFLEQAAPPANFPLPPPTSLQVAAPGTPAARLLPPHGRRPLRFLLLLGPPMAADLLCPAPHPLALCLTQELFFPMAPPALPCPRPGWFQPAWNFTCEQTGNTLSLGANSLDAEPFFHLWPTPYAAPLSARPATVASKFPAPSSSCRDAVGSLLFLRSPNVVVIHPGETVTILVRFRINVIFL
jgi:hypothetical protein